MADHFEMDGIADYSIISGLQTTYIQRSTTALNRPICQNGKCKNMKNQLSGLKCTSLMATHSHTHSLTRECVNVAISAMLIGEGTRSLHR